MSASSILTIASIGVVGLMAGLFYGWMVSVIPGTRRIDDHDYIATMQQINRSIVNPGFVVPFIGTPLLLLAAAAAQRQSGNDRAAALLATSAVVYIVGLLGVTAGGNIPLNNALGAFDLGRADSTELSERRTSYEQPWNRWHAVRTGAVVIAFALAATASFVEAD